MKIKILVLNIDDVGGIERVALNMLQMFYKSTLFSNVEIISVNGKGNSQGISIMNGGNENMKLFRFAKSLDSDVIVFSLYDRFSIKLSLMRKILRSQFKLYACQHADYYAHPFFTRILRIFFYRWIDKIIALTESDANLYIKYFSNVHVIPNVLGYYPKSIPLQNERTIDCAAAGRLVPIKQFQQFYRMLYEILHFNSRAVFRLYGDGPEANQLTELLRSYGIRSEDVQVGITNDIYSELNKVKFFFVTSKRESFSMVILEAMACGCVVISYDCPTGPRELIKDGLNGFLVKADDVNGLVNCYLKIYNNEMLCQEISNNARKTALNYLESNVIKMWSAICE